MNRRLLYLSSGPLAFLAVQGIPQLNGDQSLVLGTLAWMLSWWMSNLIPLGVTALLPMLIFPLGGILDAKTVGSLYGHPIIFLFLGGFALGLAIEKWHLHRRIALNILLISGGAPERILLGTMASTALLSMWISNTATTVMMLPIGVSLYKLLETKLGSGKAARNFGIALMLGIAYAANIGGMATLIGTPPNLVFASLSSSSLNREVAFADWLIFALPLSALLFFVVWLFLSKVLFPSKEVHLGSIKPMLKEELAKLGPMQAAEKRVAIVLASMAVLWIFRAQLNAISYLKQLSDTIIAIAGMVALFLVPSSTAEKALLREHDLGKLPWNIILLFGGGLSLAKALEVTEVVQSLAQMVMASGWQSLFVISLIICAFAIFLTEVMSNVALVSVFIPVAFIIATQLGMDAWALSVPLTLGASCAFMFPVATPPNAIVYSSGFLKTQDMARAGLVFNLFSIAIITVYSYYVMPLILF